MPRYSYAVGLRIWHPSINPEEITSALGIKPFVTHEAGARRKTPKGNILDGTYSESYWTADPFSRGDYSSTDDLAEDTLIEVLEILKPHKAFLLRLRNEGARIHLQVSSYSGRNYALEFAPEFINTCAELCLTLVHDVYPCAQTW
jgi:hypothetical protein